MPSTKSNSAVEEACPLRRDWGWLLALGIGLVVIGMVAISVPLFATVGIVTVIGIFLIAHGLVHAGLSAAPIPNDPEPKPGEFFTAIARSWIFGRIGANAKTVQRTGIVLVALSIYPS